MKVSDDHTLFAWSLPLDLSRMDQITMQSWSRDAQQPDSLPHSQLRGLLASSPSDFVTKHDLRPLQSLQPDMPLIMSSNGVRIELPVWTKSKLPYQFAAISCYIYGHNTEFLGIPLRRWDERYTARCGPLVLLSEADWSGRTRETLLIKQPPTSIRSLPNPSCFKIVRTSKQEEDYVKINEIYCLNGASYSQNTHTISFPVDQKGPYAVLFFSQNSGFRSLLLSKYRHLAQQKTSENREYGLDEARGYSFASPFAIVLGSDTRHWAAFISILHDAGAEKDFHKLLRKRKDLVKYCTTKTQLKLYLDSDQILNLDKRYHLDECLHRAIGNWFYNTTNTWETDSDIHRYGIWAVGLSLKLLVRPVNFAVTAVFVFIDITLRKTENDDGSSQIVEEELHQINFTGNWWDVPGFKQVPICTYQRTGG